jgi:hypothetical protein
MREQLTLWGPRVASVLIALLILAVLFPGLHSPLDTPGVPINAAVFWILVVFAPVVLIFIGQGKHQALRWTGWGLLGLLSLGILIGGFR